METTLSNIFLVMALVLFAIRFIYWKITEARADREKPRKDPAYSKKRMVTTAVALLVGLQIIGIQILPFEPNNIAAGVGLLLVATGFAVSMEARRVLGTNWAHAAEYQIKKDHELITKSIYHYIRHPIYSGYYLSIIGIELILGSYLSVVFAILAIPVMNYQAASEEKILTDYFGTAYAAYKKRTFRFIPYLW